MKRTLGVICATLALAACGGGDETSLTVTPAPKVEASAEGFWTGATSTGGNAALTILEDGQTWGIYTSPSDAIIGALYGNTITSGTSLAGSGSEFNFAARTVSASTYSGTFTDRAHISVSGATSSSGTYQSAYDSAASLSTIAGSFNGEGVTGNSSVQTISLSVASDGTVSSPGSLGCSADGQVVPRPSGKNIFDVSVRFTGTFCTLGDGTTATGIGYYDTSTQKVLVMVMNSAKTDGFVYVGTKVPASR